MTNIKGDFIDAYHITIINDVPCYFYSGNTYLEKLKNGISLDYMFMLEDSLIQPDEIVEQIIEKPKPNTPCKSMMFIEEYDYDILPMQRKGKKINKKPAGKNMKKNKIKQNGYNDKVSFIEDNWQTICTSNVKKNNHNNDYETLNYLNNLCPCIVCTMSPFNLINHFKTNKIIFYGFDDYSFYSDYDDYSALGF